MDDMFGEPTKSNEMSGGFDPLAAMGGPTGGEADFLAAAPVTTSGGDMGAMDMLAGQDDGPTGMDALAAVAPGIGPVGTLDTVSQESKDKIAAHAAEAEKRVAEKNDQEVAAKKKKREQATKDLQGWYGERKDKMKKKAVSNRREEKDWIALQNENKPKDPWERVMSLITEPEVKKDEVLDGYKDTSRFKQLLITLKGSQVPN